jgi:ABC-type nitrate/sulfonate/bicarbonate transport system substrate-binding protein
LIHLAIPSRAASSAVPTLAKRAGLFEKYDVPVQVDIGGNSSQLVEALARGELPIVYLAAAGVVETALAGADLVIFATGGVRLFHAIVAQPEITTAEQLRGKTVGYNGINEKLYGGLALSHIGLDIDQDVRGVRIVAEPQQRLEGLQRGELDAIIVTPPITFRARKLGFSQLVTLTDVNQPTQGGSFAASRSFVASERETVLRFTKAISEAIKLFKTDRDQGLAAVAEHTQGTDAEEVEASWQLFASTCVPSVPEINLPGLRFVMDRIVPNQEARNRQPEEFADLSIVDQLRDEGFYRQLWGADVA